MVRSFLYPQRSLLTSATGMPFVKAVGTVEWHVPSSWEDFPSKELLLTPKPDSQVARPISVPDEPCRMVCTVTMTLWPSGGEVGQGR